MSERLVRALNGPAGEGQAQPQPPPLWVRREEFLAALEPGCARAAGGRAWSASEPWVRAALGAARDPAVRLAELPEWSALLDRHSTVELQVEGEHTHVFWVNAPDAAPSEVECELRMGALSALLEDGGGAGPDLHHPVCAARDGDTCAFVVEGLHPRADHAHGELLREVFRLHADLQGRAAREAAATRGDGRTRARPPADELAGVRRFMEDVEDIVLILDRNLCILDANRAAVAFSGMTRDELLGQAARDLLSADSMRRVGEHLALLFGEGFRRGLRVEGRTRAGWVPLELSARLSEGGDTIVCIARDISAHLHLERELAERNQQLRAQNERIREADLLKSEFLANVSHELTTPLTAIRGFARLLADDVEAEVGGGAARLGAEKRLELLRVARNEADRMRDLIGGLLELSRLESGAVSLDCARVSLNAIVEESLLVVKPRLDERRLQVERRLEPELPLALLDPDRMKQVALNLLDNAIKFSPPGGRLVVSTSAVKSTVQLSLRNPSPGLSESQLESIFERFVQRDGSYTRETGGVGLGLNLVRAIAELHGGSAGAHLPEPGWVEFVVRLPRR